MFISYCLSSGADGAGIVKTTEIVFRREFRDACRSNACGSYGRNWMCPPDVGEFEDLTQRVMRYPRMLVYQTIGRLEDSFDFEGMQAAAERHHEVGLIIAAELLPKLGGGMHLAAGACRICPICARRTDEPCRLPERATASLESHCIDVGELAKSCGLQYTNGKNTVTYFGGLLYGDC